MAGTLVLRDGPSAEEANQPPSGSYLRAFEMTWGYIHGKWLAVRNYYNLLVVGEDRTTYPTRQVISYL